MWRRTQLLIGQGTGDDTTTIHKKVVPGSLHSRPFSASNSYTCSIFGGRLIFEDGAGPQKYYEIIKTKFLIHEKTGSTVFNSTNKIHNII